MSPSASSAESVRNVQKWKNQSVLFLTEKKKILFFAKKKKTLKKNFADGRKNTFFFRSTKLPHFGFYMSQDTFSRDQHHGFDHVGIQQQQQRQQWQQ